MKKANFHTLTLSLLGVLLVCFTGLLSAQNSFSVSADSVFASKPSNIFVFYNYINFENNTNDTIAMRWRKVESFSSNANEPGNIWDIGIQDHVNFYNPANHLDSADFFIPTITGSTDKFLLHLFPNNLAGHLMVKFQFFPINDPTDIATVVFDYNSEEVVAVSEAFVENNFNIFPNPANHFFQISNQTDHHSLISIFDQSSKLLSSFDLIAHQTNHVDCTSWSNGVYFLKIECDSKVGLKQIVINNH